MRITILAIGSEGDVRYLLPLAKALQSAGHHVCMATHAVFEKMARELRLGFSLIRANPVEALDSEAGQAAIRKGRWRDFIRTIQPYVLDAATDCWTACRGVGAIIYSPVGSYFGPHICEKLGVPGIPAYYLPMGPTRSFPSWVVTSRQLGRVLNILTYFIAQTMTWWPLRSIINQWRRDELNLPPTGPNWVLDYYKHQKPILYAFSPHVVPKPPDWGNQIEITGYWFLDRAVDWQPSPASVDFLNAGPPPIYVGFGSMAARNAEETTALVLRAVAIAKQRCVLSGGWAGLGQGDLPEHVFKLDWTPHDWLFPQMAAAVHHGGAGTTAAVLRAGIPGVVVPHMADQPFWGERAAALGVGPRPILRSQLTAERLAAAITEAVSDKRMHERAAALGEQIRAEDGVGRALQVIHRYLPTRLGPAGSGSV